LYVLPGFLVYAVFVLLPILNTFRLSLYEWNGVAVPRFVGLENFARMPTDEFLVVSFRNNLLFIPFFTLLPMAFALLLTALLSRRRIRALTFFRTGLFIPYVMPMIVVGVIWRWIYNPAFGPLNEILGALGLDAWARAWLGDYDLALPSLGVAGAWVTYGFSMALFVAGVQNISEELYDAARIDGSNEVQQFWYVTLPGLRNELTIVLLANFITSIRMFDLVYVTTRGGPGSQTMVLNLWLYLNAFHYSRVGYASAIAVVMTAIIFLASYALVILRQRSTTEG
jgi:raffinose/stachyose/melibiose transport system permease protein